ncbi:hypothetical protein K458DRAFT_419921 [Lentithecium fluviatile CBS 122367]|uniref:Anaphase-promoting complex, subunit CDC26 n=1 Tax=Lentithecium fluviatile CBS 122367 TaxID=1168545 RepID=A0A6G1IWL5_9PLEO|nr:hypothetical protein K458DRAFT_419921 [Lentithecium fluviatile CBS 122367]
MLRRAPTTITLTSADLEIYEANRQRKNWEKQHQHQDPQSDTSAVKVQMRENNKPSQKDRILGGQRQGN